ncbi:MAG: DNA repair protein rad16 [Piccolia ochrophora]|nr:MAG: DNA repair protein rad16 [Piccolia ochrophora]
MERQIDASDEDLEDELSTITPEPSFKSTAKVLSGVAIPRKAMTAESRSPAEKMKVHEVAVGKLQNAPSTRMHSSTSSSADGDLASEYDTPGTSAVATPAEISSRKTPAASSTASSRSTRPRVNAATRARELSSSHFSLARLRNKRKRISDDDSDSGMDNKDDSMDAQLARALQEEEDDEGFAEEPSKPLRRSRNRGTRVKVEDSVADDEDLALSSELSTPPSDDAPHEIGDSTRLGSIATRRIGRAARESARKNIASASRALAQIKVGDSEESDMDLSDLDSDDFVGTSTSASDAEESFSDDGLGAAHVSDQPDAAPTQATTRGSRRSQPIANVSNRNRHRRQPKRAKWMSRADRERVKLEKYHPEISTMWDNLAAIPVIPAVKAEQPTAITRKLKSFQLEGLNWMTKQEKTKWGGGLLGDEMGMGKTIQAVSLIMSDFPAKDPTLVIVPPVALMQWQNEINMYTDGKLKILVYHGVSVKKMSIKQLRSYNVLMTSCKFHHSTLEATHRREMKGLVRKDGEGDKYLIKEESPLHSIHWHRIILDEAHNIKTRTTATAKACFALKANYKWCLSGTPLQNRIGELFSLLRFLQVTPFACYMCKKCTCKEVHWAMDSTTRQCTVCKHRGFDHVSIFNMELLNPIVDHGNKGAGKEAFRKLRILMERIMLRRLKIDHLSSMELPAKDIMIHNEFFGEIERDFASSIMTNTTRTFDTYVAQGVMLNNYANIFGLIMQMRQVADHPDMILRKHAEGGQNILVCAICDDPAEDAIRSACHHDFCRACVKSYVKGFEQQAEDPGCPRCHIALAIDLEQVEREQDEQAVKKSSIINRIKMEKWTSSTKIEMLVYELAQMRSKKHTSKSIVFSQFTSMLQLVEWRLRRAGFNTVMLDGTMTPAQRQSSIDFFMNNPDVEVFLVSLKAGGVALNLTEASKVFLVDPWWNPAAEWQSADRCHRIGQCRPCSITRLVIEDSVESRMVMLQEKKANMINGTMNADESAMQNLSPEDMQFLFRGT